MLDIGIVMYFYMNTNVTKHYMYVVLMADMVLIVSILYCYYRIAEEAALNMVQLLGSSLFTVFVSHGDYIIIVEKSIHGDSNTTSNELYDTSHISEGSFPTSFPSKTCSSRVLFIQCGNIFDVVMGSEGTCDHDSINTNSSRHTVNKISNAGVDDNIRKVGLSSGPSPDVMHTLPGIHICHADIILFEIDVLSSHSHSVLLLLQHMKDNSRLLTYVNMEMIWSVNVSGGNREASCDTSENQSDNFIPPFCFTQLSRNKCRGDSFRTSWSVQRGHHLYMWLKQPSTARDVKMRTVSCSNSVASTSTHNNNGMLHARKKNHSKKPNRGSRSKIGVDGTPISASMQDESMNAANTLCYSRDCPLCHKEDHIEDIAGEYYAEMLENDVSPDKHAGVAYSAVLDTNAAHNRHHTSIPPLVIEDISYLGRFYHYFVDNSICYYYNFPGMFNGMPSNNHYSGQDLLPLPAEYNDRLISLWCSNNNANIPKYNSSTEVSNVNNLIEILVRNGSYHLDSEMSTTFSDNNKTVRGHGKVVNPNQSGTIKHKSSKLLVNDITSSREGSRNNVKISALTESVIKSIRGLYTRNDSSGIDDKETLITSNTDAHTAATGSGNNVGKKKHIGLGKSLRGVIQYLFNDKKHSNSIVADSHTNKSQILPPSGDGSKHSMVDNEQGPDDAYEKKTN